MLSKSNPGISYSPEDAIKYGLECEIATLYLTNAGSAGAEARSVGATFTATTYTAAIPAQSADVVGGTWSIYELETPQLVSFISSEGSTIVLLDNSNQWNTDTGKLEYNTGAKVDTLIAAGFKGLHYPKVVAAISGTRLTDADFAGVNPFLVKRFAVKSNTATATRIGVRLNKHTSIILISKT